MQSYSLKIADDFYFKRKNLIKDLYTIESFYERAAIVRCSFPVFISTLFKYGAYAFKSAERVFVDIREPDEVEALLQIHPAMRPFLVLVLPKKDEITKELLDAFSPTERCAVAMIDEEDTEAAALRIGDLDSEAFRSFQSRTCGYIINSCIERDATAEDIANTYERAYFVDSFWCVSLLLGRYDTTSQETLFHLGFIRNNLLGRKVYSPTTKKSHLYDYLRRANGNVVRLFADGCFTPDLSSMSVVHNIDEIKDTAGLLSKVRRFYDIPIPVNDRGLTTATALSNDSGTGSTAASPWSNRIADLLLDGGNRQ